MDTIFNLGSITKPFTSVAIAQLVEQGRAAFYEPLGTYLDGLAPEIADTVTVHHLLTHTSGMASQQNPGDGEADSVEAAWKNLVTMVREATLDFTPGTRSSYSNVGFVALGLIVVAVTGGSYYDYLRANVFAPAGMTRTDFYTRPQRQAADDIARPYALADSGDFEDVSDQHPFIGSPAGSVYSTADDMHRFTLALRDGTLLSPAMAEAITSPKVPSTPTPGPSLPPTSGSAPTVSHTRSSTSSGSSVTAAGTPGCTRSWRSTRTPAGCR